MLRRFVNNSGGYDLFWLPDPEVGPIEFSRRLANTMHIRWY